MNGESDYLKEKTSLDISSTEGIPSKGTKGRFCKLMHKKMEISMNVLHSVNLPLGQLRVWMLWKPLQLLRYVLEKAKVITGADMIWKE